MMNRILMSTLVMLSPVSLVAQSRSPMQPQVEVWLNDNGTFDQGDRMRVFFRTDRDAYVTVVRVTTDGHVRILFPEAPIENNFVAGDAEYEIVQYGGDDYRIHDEPGHGYVFAVASTLPFDYTAFSTGAMWDYHLLAFEGEEERDPYDTFAHFMDDILAPGTQETFAYQAVSYSVDERGSSYYRNTYRYYAVPQYHGCHVYRAFWGLRSYYTYHYDCAAYGVDIILGTYGHYYHDDYYHYGYRGYSTYYYGAGSVYRYRYVGGGYRHDHGARRVSRSIYSGLGRHSEANTGANDGRVVDRRPASPTTRRTVPDGSPVRTVNTPTGRRVGSLTPQSTTERRGVATPSAREPSEPSEGRRTTTTVSPQGTEPAQPTPRTTSGSLTRRQTGTTRGTTSEATPGSSTPQRRETSPQPGSAGGAVLPPSTTRRTPSASPSPSTTRRTPSSSPSSSPSSTTRRTPSASSSPSPSSTTRRTPSASPRPSPSTTRSTPSASPRPSPSTTRSTPSASPRPSAPRSAPSSSPSSSGSRSTGSSPSRSTGSSAPSSRSPAPSTSRRRPGT